MTRIDRTKAAVRLLLVGLAALAASPLPAAEEEPNDALVQMIVDLVSDADRDMRALGFQQVREEVPGEAATKTFAGLLPKLPPDGQAGLLEALGDRGDATAKGAVVDMLKSEQEAVRAAAVGALGALGSAAEVPLLAEKAAAGSEAEEAAARQSLARLQGEDVNAAIVSAINKGEPDVQVALLGVLAARNAEETLPSVLESAESAEPSVRLAALGALRFLADENHAAAIAKIVKAAKDDAERRKARLTLLSVCSRGREACADAVIASLADADVPSRIALLYGLARAGGPKALETIVAHLEDDDETVRDEAVRIVSAWPDPAVASHLLEIAKAQGNLRHQVLAIRGLVRLASPQEDKPADMAMLTEAMKLAARPQEKRLVLGVLGGVAAPESLALATSALDDPTVADEAGLAAVMIAEKMEDGDKDSLRAAMKKVLEATKDPKIRERAEKVAN